MTSQPSPDPSTDPTIAVAERQLVLLSELAEIAMAATRAFGLSAVAAAEAEQRVLTEEWYTPEVGRAQACGAKDAAESLQKASRALRLTLKLQMAVAEIVRDIRAGVVTHSHADGAARAPQDLAPRGAGIPARLSLDVEARDRDRRGCDSERLIEFERPDTLLGAPLEATVNGLCADIGVAIDWIAWKVVPPDVDYGASTTAPSGPSDTRVSQAESEDGLPARATPATVQPP